MLSVKRFVRFTALALALLFLGGSAFAWLDVLKQRNLLSNPQTRTAVSWLVTGLMFFALGTRGLSFRWRWRWREDNGKSAKQTSARP